MLIYIPGNKVLIEKKGNGNCQIKKKTEDVCKNYALYIHRQTAQLKGSFTKFVYCWRV